MARKKRRLSDHCSVQFRGQPKLAAACRSGAMGSMEYADCSFRCKKGGQVDFEVKLDRGETPDMGCRRKLEQILPSSDCQKLRTRRIDGINLPPTAKPPRVKIIRET